MRAQRPTDTTPWTQVVDCTDEHLCLGPPARLLGTFPGPVQRAVAGALPADAGAVSLASLHAHLTEAASRLPHDDDTRRALTATADAVAGHLWAACSCRSDAFTSLAGSLDPHLAALGDGPWAVLGPDGEFVADLDEVLTIATLTKLPYARDPWLRAELVWDPAGTLTITLTGTASTGLTAHRLTGDRADVGHDLDAARYDYSIENPYCLAHRHDPALIRYAMALIDDVPAITDELGYLDHVVETIEPTWPLTSAQQRTLTALADGWTGGLDELVHVSLTLEPHATDDDA